jgi:hypothetical protein
MKRFAWRVLSFTLELLILSLLWLVLEVPYSIRYWFEDRWHFITELWATIGEESNDGL